MIKKFSHPNLIEINTCVFINKLSKKYKKQLTLSSIPKEEWKNIAEHGQKRRYAFGKKPEKAPPELILKGIFLN